MNDYYTVLMISTINSLYGVFTPEVRMQHTLESIESVRRNIPNAKIILIDNSNESLNEQWKRVIESKVEVFHQVRHNLFSFAANVKVEYKSMSEANMLFEALNVLRQTQLIGKRIFKISGRYKIKDSFNIQEYENPAMQGKYTFVLTPMASSNDDWRSQRKCMWAEQALISFSPENIDEFQNLLLGVLTHIQISHACIEETMFQYVPHEKIYPIQVAHVEGVKAQGDGVVNH